MFVPHFFVYYYYILYCVWYFLDNLFWDGLTVEKRVFSLKMKSQHPRLEH